ncbi:MAG: zinc-binding dehydrogenase [Burkholderiaceae bacterium]|nr:zinc-binding dehydrogenase [Burkholderiaceae bacterium]
MERRVTALLPPATGEVRVRVEAAGVAYADIAVRQGLYRGVSVPVTPGYDFVGHVEALGPDVEGLHVGARVAGVTISGSYASRRNVNANWIVPAPESASAVELVAATLNGVTAWQMFHRVARPEAGEWVLVHGAAGGVGTLLLDLAKLHGVRAIGSASPGKHEVIRERGAVAVDYREQDVCSIARQISGGGVSAVFDPIGGGHLRRVSIPSLREGGTAVLYGGYETTRGGRIRPTAVLDLLLNSSVSAFRLFSRSQTLATYAVPSWRDHRNSAYKEDLTHVLSLVAKGAICPHVGATFPLAEAARAQQALESRAVAGKVVLMM